MSYIKCYKLTNQSKTCSMWNIYEQTWILSIKLRSNPIKHRCTWEGTKITIAVYSDTSFKRMSEIWYTCNKLILKCTYNVIRFNGSGLMCLLVAIAELYFMCIWVYAHKMNTYEQYIFLICEIKGEIARWRMSKDIIFFSFQNSTSINIYNIWIFTRHKKHNNESTCEIENA